MPTLTADHHQSQCIQRQDVLDQAIGEVLADPEMFAEAVTFEGNFLADYFNDEVDAEMRAARDALMQMVRHPASHLERKIAAHVMRQIGRYAEHLAERRCERMGL